MLPQDEIVLHIGVENDAGSQQPEYQDDVDGRFSDSDIVPDEDQARLINLRDMMTACSWGIGDIANDLIWKNAQAGIQVTAKRIYKAVGRFCGRSGRTVRYYAETSSFYSVNIREEFEVLSFAHFVFARQMKELWREVLEYASSVPGATVEQLEAKYLKCQNSDTGEQDSEQSREISQFIAAVGSAVDVPVVDSDQFVDYHKGTESHESLDNKYTLINASSALISALSEYRKQIHSLLGDKSKFISTVQENDRIVSEMRDSAKRVAQIASAL